MATWRTMTRSLLWRAWRGVLRKLRGTPQQLTRVLRDRNDRGTVEAAKILAAH